MATVIRKMLDYAARPLSEFNKYKAMDILETLQNTSRDNQDEILPFGVPDSLRESRATKREFPGSGSTPPRR